MKPLIILLCFCCFGTKLFAQAYLVSSSTGKVYSNNQLLKSGDVVIGTGTLTAQKQNCTLKVNRGDTNEDILIFFKNGHLFRIMPLKKAKENELFDLTFNAFISDYNAQKYLATMSAFDWDKFLTEYPDSNERLLITTNERIPFTPVSEIPGNKQLVVCVFNKSDSVYYQLEIKNDSLSLGAAFHNEFIKHNNLVTWKLKLKTTNGLKESYDDMSGYIRSTLMSDRAFEDEISDLVQMEKSGGSKQREQYYESVISCLRFTYGRVLESTVKEVIDKEIQ
jgi:hypothetical protein